MSDAVVSKPLLAHLSSWCHPRMEEVTVEVLALGLVAVLLLGCGRESTTDPAPDPRPVPARPTSISITPATVSLTALGDTVRLTAEVQDQRGQAIAGAVVAWATSDTAIATVNAAGLVTATGNGTTSVTATSESASGSAAVAVIQAAHAVAVSPAADMLNIGDTLRLSAEAFDANGHKVTGVEFAWSSSDPSVARVGGSGLVSGVGEGMATVTAASGNAKGDSDITVGNPDRAVLAAFYHATGGPNWANADNWLTDAPLGDWHGVETDRSGRVVGLRMSEWDSRDKRWISNNLSGPIPAELGSLSSLRSLRLRENRLTGSIPPEIGNLAKLTSLELEANQLSGPIPPELGNLSNLTLLRLGGNNLSGPIPPEFGNLTELTWLSLHSAQLSGPIPQELGNLTQLTFLRLSRNGLTGPIPEALGKLAKLTRLWLYENDLSGPVPPALAGLANLTSLYLYDNYLSGPIPRSFLNIPGLTAFRFHRNDGLCTPGTTPFMDWLGGIARYEGPFCNETDRSVLTSLFETAGGSAWTTADGWLDGPALADWHGVSADSLGHVTALDLGRNGLVGRLPRTMGQLARLAALRIGGNPALSGRLPSSLVDLSLRELHYPGTGLCVPVEPAFREWLNALSSHEGTGVGCEALSDRDILEIVYDATGGPNWTNRKNWLTDQPLDEWHGVSVDNSGRVTSLILRDNNLSGSIPPELGSLKNLEYANANGNELSGPIPAELGNLTTLRHLHLNDNDLSGSIPPELGRLANLSRLYLNDNELSGSIPSELGGLTSLERLYLDDNDLSGPIPPQLGNLASLHHLNLGINELSGPLPRELGGLVDLTRLYLNDNKLSGPVPHEFGGMASLEEFVLAVNTDMSGPLPTSLTSLPSLEIFSTGGTMLCAPSDAAFLEWLADVSTQRVLPCESDPVGAYLVQAVQSGAFPVPLVAGEEALLRVFPTAARTNQQRLPAVRASFYLDGVVTQVADIRERPGPIPTEVDEGSLAQSINAVIPTEVIRPGLEMVVEVDPDGALDPGLGVARRIPETGRVSVDVREMPPLDLTVIPFLWSTDPDSTILEQTAGMAADPYGHELLELTRTLLPVRDLRVTAHEPVLSSSNDAHVLFAETKAIRALEGGTGHYLGMLSGSLRGAAGVAARPGRVSFARDRSWTIAHELGHNMNLRHGTSSSCCVDPAYPYPGGTIGAWGYDFRDGGQLVAPTRRDVMAGGGTVAWISDYHFDKAFRYRLADEGESGPASPAKSLLLWGGVDSEGIPHLEPAFVVDAPPTLPAPPGEYRLSGHTGGGAELFTMSFEMPVAADGDGRASFAFVLPTRPEWQGDLASIALTGPGGSVTLDAESDLSVAILRNRLTGQVRGILRNPPQTDADLADTLEALTPGSELQILFSRGLPDAEAWKP